MTTRVPFARQEVLRSRDPVAVRDATRCLFGPHTLEVVGAPDDFDARHRRAPLGSLSLSCLGYTSAVRIATARPLPHHLVHIPLTGSTRGRVGEQEVAASPARALVISAGHQVDLRWAPGSRSLILSVDRRAMDVTLRQTLGRAPEQPLVFDHELDLTEPHARRWMATVAMIRCEVEDGPRVATHPVAERHLEQLVMAELLVAARHSHSDQLDSDLLDSRLPHAGRGTAPAGAAEVARTTGPTRTVPPVVRRAAELIQARAAEPLTVAEVALAVGAGVRSLQHGFRVHLDTTPMAYLRKVRLERVRSELLSATTDTDVSVTDTAFRWGFVHPGRFAQAYRAAYGEPPSATLRRYSL